METERKEKLDAIVEQAIDEFGLQRVVESVAWVCGEKSAQVESNWQDKPLAGKWARHGALIDRVAYKLGMENT
jgi:hypothetical protein